MFLRTILMILPLIISACSTTSNNIKKTQLLKENEGVLLTNFQAKKNFTLGFKNSSGDIVFANVMRGKNNQALVAMNLPAGKYKVKKLNFDKNESISFDNSDYKFSIKSGKVNYVCDFLANFKETSFPEKKLSLKALTPVYLQKKTVKKFKKQYPMVSKKYPFVSSLTSKCISANSKKAQQLLSLLKKK